MRPGDIETRGLGAGSYPEPPDVPKAIPHCPVCGEECEWIYKYEGSEVVGCDMCLTAASAYDEPECYEEQ